MMPLGEVAVVLGSIAGAIVSIGIIWSKGVKPVVAFIRRTDAVYNRVELLPEWCASVDESLKQLHPNGGKSLKDRVNQTHQMMVTHLEDHERVSS